MAVVFSTVFCFQQCGHIRVMAFKQSPNRFDALLRASERKKQKQELPFDKNDKQFAKKNNAADMGNAETIKKKNRQAKQRIGHRVDSEQNVTWPVFRVQGQRRPCRPLAKRHVITKR